MPISTKIEKKFVCDNCGATKVMQRSSEFSNDLPFDWIPFEINVGKFTKTAVLCQTCATLLNKYKGDNIKSLISTASLLFNSRPVLTVDTICKKFENGKLKCLLIKRKNPPYGWALPGGIMESGETAEAAALRELKEETGLIGSVDDLTFVTIRSTPNRDSRFHAVSLVYLLSSFKGEPCAADDATTLGWFTLKEMEELEIAFDHRTLIQESCSVRRQHAESVNETVAKEYQRLISPSKTLRPRG